MRDRRSFDKTIGGITVRSPAYSDDGKVWLWESNGRPCPLDACVEYGIPCDMEAQRQAGKAHMEEFLAKYIAGQPAIPSAEEQAGMRAAFGPGKVIVDVISGREWRT